MISEMQSLLGGVIQTHGESWKTWTSSRHNSPSVFYHLHLHPQLTDFFAWVLCTEKLQ